MRCAVYARVSTELESQKTSIAHQISYFQKYIEDKNWELYKVYQDIESGTSINNREGLKQLIRDSRKNLFDTVLTKSISRFARNTLEGLQLVRELKAKHIRFITIEDGFDSQEYDEFMFTLLLSMAQKESEKMSQRIHFGKLCRAKKGGYNGSIPPYGYRRADSYTILPAQDICQYVVEKIFHMYLEGHGIYRIAKELNDKKYPTPSQASGQKNNSGTWHQSTIRKILSNRFYIGDLVQNKTKTEDVLTGKRQENSSKEHVAILSNHEPIIDKQSFYEVQRRLQLKKTHKQGINKHLFANILICGACGSTMHYKKDKKAYLCGKVNKHGKANCLGTYIKEDKLKTAVSAELKAIIKEHINPVELWNSLKQKMEQDHERNPIHTIDMSLRKLQNNKNRLLNMMLEGLIDPSTFLNKTEEINNTLEIMLNKKQKLERSMEENNRVNKKIMMDVLEINNLDVLLLQKMIKRIIIHQEGALEINYDFRV